MVMPMPDVLVCPEASIERPRFRERVVLDACRDLMAGLREAIVRVGDLDPAELALADGDLNRPALRAVGEALDVSLYRFDELRRVLGYPPGQGPRYGCVCDLTRPLE
jgi:hypothetical protein